MTIALRRTLGLIVLLLGAMAGTTHAAKPGELAVVQDGVARSSIVVVADAGKWEKQAALDLQKYIEMMSGARLSLGDAAPDTNAPVLVIGAAAFKLDPTLRAALEKVKKKNPTLRADAIVLRRRGNRVLLAGSNDDSHYYAVAELLKRWGCRWFMPSEFGEYVPFRKTLSIGPLDYAYAPPFEVRRIWFSWYGEQSGREDFLHRNMMHDQDVAIGHALGHYSEKLVPPGKTLFNVPIADEKTAEHVAAQLEEKFSKNELIPLGIEDGVYESDSPRDKELQAGLWDKYFQTPVMTDNFMTFYNNVARRLQSKYPNSSAKIGFLAYGNITLPPQRDIIAEKPLMCLLAPIDFDPIHGMDDPKSPPQNEYREIMYRWAKVMQGRVVIYDYDQGMLVWRDFPNPSLAHIRQNIKHYRNAGILGISTESRNATATTFANLYLRGQLMWNPDANVDALNADFYSKFFGPAARPMAAYWDAINRAWEETLVTEHEYFAAPAIYTPQLIEKLRTHLQEAESITKPLQTKTDPERNEKALVERMKFMRLSFDVLDNYLAMVRAGASQNDYKAAVVFGEKGLKARDALKAMNPNFTTTSLESGDAFWPGEVEQYRNLAKAADGTGGTLIAQTPLEWAFRRDPNDTGLASGFAYKPVDLSFWNANRSKFTLENRKDYPTTQWEMLRTDLYYQAQGVRHPDRQSFTGHAWYRTEVPLNAETTGGKVRIRFPGVFNQCWLYVNGSLVAHRTQAPLWWRNDYKFEWDVDLTGKVKPGTNTITLRVHNPHHMGGIFRRPFLYQPK